MEQWLEQHDLLQKLASKAALYLQYRLRKGDLPVVRADLMNLGRLGQLVVLRLAKSLTKAEAALLEEHMRDEFLVPDKPRAKARRALETLAGFCDAMPAPALVKPNKR